MNYFLKLLLVIFPMMGNAAHNRESSCTEHCNAPFGTLIGQSFLTKAYSNCSSYCFKNESNVITLASNEQKLITGMKWQCVEYARRWLIDNKGVTFADVQYAYHIWDLQYAEKIGSHQRVPLMHFKNKASKEAPQIGDLLIYSKKLAVTGHVAVIVGIENDMVTIAEQNYFNRTWEGHDYARRLLLDKDSQGRYRIYDDSIIGWVRVKQ